GLRCASPIPPLNAKDTQLRMSLEGPPELMRPVVIESTKTCLGVTRMRSVLNPRALTPGPFPGGEGEPESVLTPSCPPHPLSQGKGGTECACGTEFKSVLLGPRKM